MKALIVGGGIGGLTAALALHARGIACQVVESAPQIRPLGLGINLLPQATAYLDALGLLRALEAVAVATKEAAWLNRFGQTIHTEALGRAAGEAYPQLSIHRGELQMVLLDAVLTRLGRDAVRTGQRCTGFVQDDGGVTVHLAESVGGAALPPLRADVVVGADGLHSAIRAALFPAEGAPIYSGVNLWRGVTRMRPILSGATMVQAGWLAQGKLVAYPIRDYPDGTQLMNWVAEIETPHHHCSDWARRGLLADVLPAFADWRFDWLDVPRMLQDAAMILEYPMVDRDPLPRWSHGRVTLLGDAAHPMYPRGSNGAGQAILDAKALVACLGAERDPVRALQAYEAQRLGPTTRLVIANRTCPPDAILREVWQRTGDKPFARIEAVIGAEEITALREAYRLAAGEAEDPAAR
jgi:2-polyprenyl-6-methoxyphenol hydroxylase-like FAD-dependent oxidoreductase